MRGVPENPVETVESERARRRHAITALLYAVIVLTVLEYWFYPPRLEAILRGLHPSELVPPSMRAGLQWAAGTIVAFMVLPAILVRFVQRRPLASIGYGTRGVLRHLWVYLGLFLLMLPLILAASQREDFSDAYPFIREATSSLDRFLLWESAYLLQFFALESFFRGYLLFTLERAMGNLAVFVMVVPYGMLHFHKPPLEAFGAIIAGVVLGFLALRYRSWYGGAVLHCLVALAMDGLATHREGLWD